ncbi:amidohydrolase family protein [Paenibacillus sp. GCM10023252]|uniref:amidohydrolase family protein n=1 Tax=Paenibacillus sp. GCM10023252 TaxID=3252649 RepID=UPI00361E3BDA
MSGIGYVRRVRIGSELYSLAIQEGKFAEIERSDAPLAAGETGWDAQGLLYTPTMADMHCHLDKHFIGEGWRSRKRIDTLPNQLRREQELLAELEGDVASRARTLLNRMLSYGTTRVRTHVDVDPDIGLRHLEAVLRVREEYRDRMDIEIVAFPQQGLIRSGSMAVMREAMGMGAEYVGAVDPAGLDRSLEPCLDGVFELASEYDAGVDIHLHDPGHLGLYTIDRIADYTVQSGKQGRVAVSHAWALGEVGEGEIRGLAPKLSDSGVAIITSVPIDRQMPPVALLDELGVQVMLGTDNVLDAWSPFGSGDLLERACRLAERSYWVEDEQLLGAYRYASAGSTVPSVGEAATFMLVEAMNLQHAVAAPPAREWVFYGGRPVAGRKYEQSC